MKTAFLFPGQGSQYPGFLDDLPNDPVVRHTLSEAEQLLETTIGSLHSPNALSTTKAVQQSLLIAGVAMFRLFEENGVKPDYVAGHSVGAFGAAVAAGACSFEQALKLVTIRGGMMEDSLDLRYGMGVVVGLTEDRLLDIVADFHTEEQPVYVSNRNSPTQITLSGDKEAIQRVLAYVDGKGAHSAKMLNVSTPSHCPLFEHVKEALEHEMADMFFQRPKVPVAANRNARLLRQADAIKADLAESICHPVRWHDATNVLYENGVRIFIEMPPGDVLTKLANAAFPDTRAISTQKVAFEDALYILNHKGV